MIIERNRRKVDVPDDFFEEDYIFGVVRFRRIKALSGLSYAQFAKTYGFSSSSLKAWAGNRKKGKNNNPNPEARLRLAFIEADLSLRLIQGEKKAA